MRKVASWLVVLAITLAAAEALARQAHRLPGIGPTLYRGGRGPESDRLGWYLLGGVFRGGGQVGYDPVLGWIPIPGVWEEHGATITVNAQGFRGTQPTSPTPPPGKTRVVAVGDSFTFGSEGSDGTIWTDRLVALRPDLDVVNLGVFGYGLDQMWLRWDDVGRPLDADVVLIAFIDDDFRRTRLDFQVYERPLVPAEEGVFDPVNTPLPTWEEERRRIARTPRLWMLARMAWNGTGGKDFSDGVVRGGAIVDHWVEEVRAAGAKPVLVHLPTGWDLDQRKSTDPDDYDTRERKWFLERCGKGDVPCLDLLPPVLARIAAGDDVTAIIHYDELGNDVVAREIAAGLERAGLIPPATAPAVATP